VALDPTTVAALRAWRVQQAEERLAAGPAWTHSGGRIVTQVDGRPLRPSRLSEAFTATVRAAGLSSIGVHGLHSYASASLRAGVSPEVLARRLGHADVAVTLSIDAQVLDTDDEAAAATAAAAIFGSSAGPS
jgi:integrase